MTERFAQIVSSLHLSREELLLSSRKRKTSKRKTSKKKKLTFTSPELEKIFNTLPPDMQQHLLKGGKR